MKSNKIGKQWACAILGVLCAIGILVTGCNTGEGIKEDAEDAGEAIEEGVEEVIDEVDDAT